MPQNGDAAWVSYGGAALFKPVHAVRHASCRKVRGNPSGRYKAGFYGGILCMRFDDAIRINGWSNQFWGWGREDFEIGIRMLRAGLRPQRPCAARAGAFKCYPHRGESRMRLRFSRNKELSEEAWTDPALLQRGLSDASFDIIAHRVQPRGANDGHGVDTVWATANLKPTEDELLPLTNNPCDEHWDSASMQLCARLRRAERARRRDAGAAQSTSQLDQPSRLPN